MHTAFKLLYTCTYVKESWLCITTCVNNTWDKNYMTQKSLLCIMNFIDTCLGFFHIEAQFLICTVREILTPGLLLVQCCQHDFHILPGSPSFGGVNEWYIAYTQNNYTNVFTFSTPSLSSTHLFDQAIRHFFCTHSTKHNSNLFVGEFNRITHQYLQPYIRHRCTAMSLEYGSKIFTIHVHSSLEEESPRTKIHLLYCIKQFL